MRIVGVDPSLSNFGIVRANYDDGNLDVHDMTLLRTEKEGTGGADYLRRAKLIFDGFQEAIWNADLIIAEIPHGSQSATAAWTLGIVIGVLASCDKPLIQVTSYQVKKVVSKKDPRKVSKRQVIEWAHKRYPDANWRYYRKRLVNANEHLADAVAAIHAGMETTRFTELVNGSNGNH